MPDYQNNLVVLTRGGINAKTVATTTIDTTEDGTRKFVPINAVIVCTAATAITSAPGFSIGSNASAYDNIIVPTVISTFDATGEVAQLYQNMSAILPNVAANTDIVLKINTGAVGTSMTIRVDVIGYYA